MVKRNSSTLPGKGEEGKSNQQINVNTLTTSGQSLGAPGSDRRMEYAETLDLDEEWTKENDDRLKKITKLKLKNPHVQYEEQRLREKLKVVILSGKIKRGNKKLREVLEQLRFSQATQYRPLWQRKIQYQIYQRPLRPLGMTQRYQQNQQGVDYWSYGNQQAGRKVSKGSQIGNTGQTRLNPPADMAGKCYVCSGEDHIAPRCQAFGEERRFDLSKERCTNQKCAGYLGYHTAECRQQ